MQHETSAFFNKDRRTEFNDQHVLKFAERNSATYVSLFRGRLLASAALLALGCLELGLAARLGGGEDASSCSRRLPSWLLADGSLAVLAAGVALLAVRRKGAALGNVDLQAYLLRKDRGGEEDPAYEGRLAAADAASCPERLGLPCSCALGALFGLGCWWYRACGAGQEGQWMALVLTAKLLVPMFSFCLSMSCCLLTFMRKDPTESYWDDQPTDFW